MIRSLSASLTWKYNFKTIILYAFIFCLIFPHFKCIFNLIIKKFVITNNIWENSAYKATRKKLKGIKWILLHIFTRNCTPKENVYAYGIYKNIWDCVGLVLERFITIDRFSFVYIHTSRLYGLKIPFNLIK